MNYFIKNSNFNISISSPIAQSFYLLENALNVVIQPALSLHREQQRTTKKWPMFRSSSLFHFVFIFWRDIGNQFFCKIYIRKCS